RHTLDGVLIGVMADHLHKQLLDVPGLEQVTPFQWQELAWKTKETVFMCVLHEASVITHPSSAPALESLRTASMDRKQERKTEKLEKLDRESVRKREDSFRADFMQIVATELRRLGAPPMLTWQKLVFDRECCVQALRLLLTRIKSSRRGTADPATPSTPSKEENAVDAMNERASFKRRGLPASTRHVTNQSDRENQSEDSEPVASRHVAKDRNRRNDLGSTPDWNSSTSLDSPSSARGASSPARADSPTMSEQPNDYMAPGMTIQRTKPRQTSMLAAKMKANQVQILQHENEQLQTENQKLKGEIAHLHQIVRSLEMDNRTIVTDESCATFENRRLRLAQAQNIQLRRQVDLLKSALQSHQEAEIKFMSALTHWRGVVEQACADAKENGADQAAVNAAKKPIKWMFAAPASLVDELSRVESLVYAATASRSSALDSCNPSASAFDSSSRSGTLWPTLPLIGDAGSQFRGTNAKQLERALEEFSRQISSYTVDLATGKASRRRPPKAQHDSDTGRLLQSCRELVMAIGAFGVAPLKQLKSANSLLSDQCSPLKILALFGKPAGGTISVGDRDKLTKTLLKQLHANCAGHVQAYDILRQECDYWKRACETQTQLQLTLCRRVRLLGEQKKQATYGKLVEALSNITQTYQAYQNALAEGTSRHSSFVALLLETFDKYQPVLVDVLGGWQSYTDSSDQELSRLMEDFEANASMIDESLQRQRAGSHCQASSMLPGTSTTVPIEGG
ncbi:TPA: hypothetical protein N0F65_007301, partial [Lagenidium giganteum]